MRVLTIKVEHHVVENSIQWRIAETIRQIQRNQWTPISRLRCP